MEGERDGKKTGGGGRARLNLTDIIYRHRTSADKKTGLVEKQVPCQESELVELLELGRLSFLSQPMLIECFAPIVIVGDIHGQFSDLLRVFQIAAWPPKSPAYLFLGDYVDRGQMGLECINLLLAMKLKYPNSFFLLRGNHECAHINRNYGFYEEVKRRYNHKLWLLYQDVFNVMPLAATVSKKIMCMHGGISPDLHNLDQIRNYERPCIITERGLGSDLLWADPELGIKGFKASPRGISYQFGIDAVENFLAKFNLDMIVRAHQVVQEGFQLFAQGKLVTVFSAPNYCNEFTNKAAILQVDASLSVRIRSLSGEDPPPKRFGLFA